MPYLTKGVIPTLKGLGLRLPISITHLQSNWIVDGPSTAPFTAVYVP
jgi:hypothetical protein